MNLVRMACGRGQPDMTRKPSVDLDDLFARHPHVYIGFSGGKDSTTLVELCSQWRYQITLLSVDTGASFPHMIDRIEQYGKRFRLQWLRSNQKQHWDTFGLPSQVVPTANVNMYARGVYAEPKVQAWQACCLNLISAPMSDFLCSHPGAVWLHGQRLSEIAPGYHPSPPMFEQGVDMGGYISYAPLRDWTEADVLAFLSERGINLPVQYRYGTGDFSLDCSNCPAMLSNGRRVTFMREHYPAELATALTHLRVTHNAAVEATAKTADAINFAAVDQNTKPSANAVA
jgi:3'-phosphoadenosine 5'-phosphosulfate sulfotransferase (PAPS reductase)/FAD synthetase